jgi:DNA-binding transcriptional LysR family regulator
VLDARRLRLLRDLAVHGTVAATAEAQHLTGPAVSQQLAALEREAGLPLLTRQGRTLQLTAAGRLLVEHAEVILGSLAAAEADLQGMRSGGRGQVRIAAFPSAARTLLPEVWHRLARGTGGPFSVRTDEPVDLSMTVSEPEAATEALRRGEVDIAIVHAYSLLPADQLAGCERHDLMDEEVVLACGPGVARRHRLRPGQGVGLADFADDRWLMPGPGTSCYEVIQRACGAAGFVPRPVAVASDFSAIIALVGAEAGITLMPRMALPADTHDISLHPIIPPITRTTFALTTSGYAKLPYLSRVLDTLRATSSAQASAQP